MIFDRGDKILFIGDSISDYSRAKPVGEGLFNAWGTSYVACAGALLGCMKYGVTRIMPFTWGSVRSMIRS